MPLSPIGAAVQLPDIEILHDWLVEGDRPVEIQDFIPPEVILGDVSDLVGQWRTALAAHRGPRGIHGPFYGLDLSNPDREIRAVVQKRLIAGIEIAAQLDADLMVIHSPFNFWHTLNYINYGNLRGELMDASAACLAPVLKRAAAEGVTLVIENIDDTAPADRLDLVQAIASPFLKLSVDTGHADLAHANYGAPPVVDALAGTGGRLGHVHLQDVDGHADRHWHPGDGRIAWRHVMEVIDGLDDAPRLILEVSSGLHRLPQTAAWLDGLRAGH